MKENYKKNKGDEAVDRSVLKNTNQAKGITLIALVITIIVLIILAGVAINTLTGDNGIITRAIQAKEETIINGDLEQLKIAVVSSYDYNNGSTNIIIDDLNNNLKQIDGFDESTMVKKLPSVVKIHEREYKIEQNGNVTIYNSEEAEIYAVFYSDNNELVFQLSDEIDSKRGTIEEGTVTLYRRIENMEISISSDIPWYTDGNYKVIKTVTFADKIYPKKTVFWFYGCSKLTTINNIENLKTKNVTSMSGMFFECKGLESLDVSGFNTSNVINMTRMFDSCTGLTSLDLSNFDTSKVTRMSYMFNKCSGLTKLDLSKFDTRNVLYMNDMFYGCSGLTELNINNFDTSNVTDMTNMFRTCRGLTSLNLSSFDTSNVTNMGLMFYGCRGLISIYVSNKWNIEKVTSSTSMFYGCTNLVGAISYDSTKKDAKYANYETGYLTLKTD